MDNTENVTLKGKEDKTTLTTNQKITRWIVIGFVSIIFLVVVITAVSELLKPAPDYDNFKSAMRTYLTTNEHISDIVINENNMFDIIVKDTWFGASEIDKLRFCNSVHETIFVYADKYNLIDSDSENVYLYFYDTTGINVAKQGFSGFEILH